MINNIADDCHNNFCSSANKTLRRMHRAHRALDAFLEESQRNAGCADAAPVLRFVLSILIATGAGAFDAAGSRSQRFRNVHVGA